MTRSDRSSPEDPGTALVRLHALARRDPHAALQQIRQIEHEAGQRWPPAALASLRLERGTALWRVGQVPAGLAEMRRASDELKVHGDRQTYAESLVSLGGSLVNLVGDLAAGMAALEEARDVAEHGGYRRTRARALNALGPVLGRLGRLEDSERVLRLALDACGADADDDPEQRAEVELNHGYALILVGRLDDALALLLPLRQRLAAAQDPLLAGCEQSIALACARQGRHAEAVAMLRRQQAQLDPASASYDWPGNLLVLGQVLLLAGDAQAAVRALDEALDYARQRHLTATEIEVLELLVQAWGAADRWDRALQAQQRLRAVERRVIDEQTAARAQVMEASALLREEQSARAALATANLELEERVQQRTAELTRQVAERLAAEERARHWAEHDWLTGLLNRGHLERLLDERAQRIAAGGPGSAVLFIDLDGFKHINDLYGHAVGDEMLRTVARRLQDVVEPPHTLVRFGGDEFVVLTADLPADTSREAALLGLGDRIRGAIAREFRCAGLTLALTASVGMAFFDPAPAAAHETIRQADRAMFRAKRQGGNRCELLDSDARHELDRRARLRRDLGPAIAGGRLQAWLQPLFDARTGRPCHYEVLARWQHPELGWVSPQEFIPIAEESGAIDALGLWALREAVVTVQALRRGHGGGGVSVNLSTSQLGDPDVVHKLLAAVHAGGGDPRDLTLELTESIQLSQDQAHRVRVEQLKAAGFATALDDFGCGYSSFEYLSRLRFDDLKIDRSLVHAAAGDDGRALIDAVVAMARALRIGVVAEGVETEPQRRLLVACGVDRLQGFLLARPMPREALLAWLSARATGSGGADAPPH